MDIQFLNQPFVRHIVQAVSWTLVHSVWQGFILVILAGSTLLLSRKSRSDLRYNVLTFLLLAFVLVSAFTFYFELNEKIDVKISSVSINLNRIQSIPDSDYFTSHASNSHITFSQFNWLIDFLNYNAFLIFTIWFSIFIFKSIRITLGVLSLYRIGNDSFYDHDYWLHFLNQLAKKAGIQKIVSLSESGRINSPMVHGILKPVIIVPLGFFTSIPPNQIEAILLHELAHIKRNDYLINLLQSFVENIFFFNPAVFWLSKLIREERECCCDDFAIDILENKTAFVDALVSFQEYRLTNSEQLITFSGRKNHLLYRIKRIILNNKNKSLSVMEKIFVTSCIITSLVLSVSFSKVNQYRTTENKERSVVKRPIFKEEIVQINQKDNIPVLTKESMIKIKNNEIKDTLPKLQDLNAEVIEAKRQYEQIRNDDAELRKNRIEYWNAIRESREQKVELKLRSEAFQKQKSNANVLSENIMANTLNQTGNSKFLAEEKHYQLNLALIKMQQEVLKMDSINIKERLETARLIEENYYKNYEPRENKLKEARQNYQQKLQEELINDLIHEKIINSKENLSFKLHNKFFIVNGITQPVTIQEKFKAKFLDASWKEWLYNFEGKTGYFVTGIRFQG